MIYRQNMKLTQTRLRHTLLIPAAIKKKNDTSKLVTNKLVYLKKDEKYRKEYVNVY